MTLGAPKLASGASDKIVHVIQGEYRVSDDPDVVFATILGSCVAACICDPHAGIGGMNHFLLPGSMNERRYGEVEHLAVHLMEQLVNALCKAGASRRHMEAKLFGGASTLTGRTDIGAQNGEFAVDFLAREDIPLVGHCLGGPNGRRVQYWPATGRARRIFIANVDIPTTSSAAPPLANADSLELL